MSLSQYYSPLRYPGGKSSLYDFLVNTLEKNGINDGVYAEGFAGGAGAALKLLMMEQVYEIHLNDSDEFVFNFWNSVLNHTEELLKLIRETKVTIKEWHYRRNVLRDKTLQNQLSIPELGFTTFFLNRCNRSGILKAGVIGGLNQAGDWKLDARYNKVDLMSRIEKIGMYRDRIHIYNDDIINFLRKMKSKKFSQKDCFTYLDPPYVSQGKDLYRHFFKTNEHKKLANFLQMKYHNLWMVSYDDHVLIHDIYKEVTKNIFEFNYYANRTKVGRELVIGSKECLLPLKYKHYQKEKEIEQNQVDFRKVM